jgi:peptide/nickel transport system permease protein
MVAIGANAIAAIFALGVGGLAALGGRVVQNALMRGVDVILSFPLLLLGLTVLVITKPSLPTIMLLIGINFGAYGARLVFAQAVSLKAREFVLAARANGVRTGRILTRHLLPHVLPSIIVYSALGIGTAILTEAAFSYVGIGIEPPAPSWGNMIAEGQRYMTSAPRLVLAPGLAIMLAMLGFSLLGDALRDALDPTLEGRVDVTPGGAR